MTSMIRMLALALLASGMLAPAFGQAPVPKAKPNEVPAVSITSPANNATFAQGASVTVTANATDTDGTIAKVEFFSETSATPFATDTTAPYSGVWASVPAGTHTLTAKATDNAGAVTTSAGVTITVTPNNRPTVSITAPANGAAFIAPASIAISATASDSDGTVAKVDFFQNSTLIGTVASPPYSVTWSNVGASGYVLTAVATDNQGATTTSAPVAISVGNPPLVVMTSPASCLALIQPASLSLSADAVDPDGWITRVEYFAGSTLVASATQPPYAASWPNIAQGTYTVTARATNNLGITATSMPVVITVSAPNAAPTASITSPAAGSTFRAGNSVAIAASAADSDGSVSQVAFFANGTFIASSNGPVFGITWPNVQPGSYSLTAVATDNLGAAATSPAIAVTVTPNAAPTVSLTAPAAGSAYRAPAMIAFAANAADSDGTIARVDFLLNGSVVATATSSPYTGSASNVAAGTYVAAARAVDNDGGTTTSAGVSVTVAANATPTVSITSPANGAAFNAPVDIPIAASAADSDGTLAKVEFFDGAALIATVTTPPYAATLRNAALGSHTLTAKATDNDGATRTSAAVTVSVSGMTSTITAPADGSTYVAPAAFDLKATVSTSSGNVTSVDFLDGSTLLQTFTITGTFASVNVTLNLSAVAAGTHVYTVVGRDNGGRSATSPPATVTVSPAPTPPAVTLTSPQNNQFFVAPATVHLAADATPGSSPLARVEFYSGATLLGTATSAPYTFDWTNVPSGGYSLTAKAIDTAGGGTTSSAVAITVGSLSIAIDSPVNGASISGDTVLVSGTVVAPANSGVTVNGDVAALDASGRFYANVPLAAGSNAITAKLTTMAGQNGTYTVTVNATGVAPAVQITASPLQGLAPLAVTIRVDNRAASDVTIRVNGSAVGSLPAGRDVSFDITYGGAGTFPFNVSATDGQGNVTSRDFVAVASSEAQVDALVKSLWNGMATALASGDKATAMGYFSGSAQALYGPIYDALAADLPQIVATWSPPLKSKLSGAIAEYAIVTPNGSGRSIFLVYFVRGPDGVWRLDGM